VHRRCAEVGVGPTQVPADGTSCYRFAMQLISAVRLRGFRSIQNDDLERLGELTVLVGRNSSGKSNVLRALNLFFNDEVDPGSGVELNRDYHARPQARKKKFIEISVDFSLPSQFRFRKGLTQLQAAIGTNFTITRRWERDPQQQIVSATSVMRDGVAIDDGDAYARQVLNLIRYRYIPNRTIPATLLREESRAIANSIFAKMSGGVGTSKVLEELGTAAARLLKRASEAMTETGAPLRDPTVSNPRTLADMLSVAGFQALGDHGDLVRDEQWGAGNQAHFLYEVLQAVDTNYSRSFGWQQAAIWGVEEPESGLHRDLETRLAQEFRAWTRDPQLKLQIVQTTHSPTFVMAADVGYWVDLHSGASSMTQTPIPQLVRDAERRGVTSWLQPVLAFPNRPVVLVEGTTDAEVLNHVTALMNDQRLLFLALPELDAAAKGGGKDSITDYLKRYGALVQNRPADAPLIVLFDWEVTGNELQNARRHYGAGADVRVTKMNEAHAAPDMSSEFAGIERFYPPDVVRAGFDAGEFLVTIVSPQPFSISKRNLDIAKGKLKPRVLAIKDPARLKQLVAVVKDVLALLV
jgi:hypothetical protein